MSTQIEVDNDVFDLLKARAEPFVDTPNSVLRRLLGMGPADAATDQVAARKAAPVDVSAAAESRNASPQRAGKKKAGVKRAAPKRTRAARGTLLPEERYEGPLLRALVDAGGQAPSRDVVDVVGRELKHQLMPADFETLGSGSVRWQSRIQFVRLRLIERGFLDRGTPRGIWGITDQGRAALTEG